MSTTERTPESTGAVIQRRARRARIVRLLALPVGLAASGVLVWQASYSAFSGTVNNTGNTFAAGTMTLTSDQPSTAMFATGTNLKPGDTVTRCITITYGGNLVPTTPVAFYVPTFTDSDATYKMSGQMLFTVDVGTPTTTINADCSNWSGTNVTGQSTFESGVLLNALPSAYASGTSTGWTPSGNNDQRVFRVTAKFNTTNDNNYQGKSVTASLDWEVDS